MPASSASGADRAAHRVRRGRDHTVLDLAFSWLLAHDPVASAITSATKPEQVRANVAAAGWRLSPADLGAVDKLLSQPT